MEIRLNLASKPYLNRKDIRLWLLVACGFLLLLLAINSYYGYQNYRELSLLESRFLELNAQLSGIKGIPEDYSTKSYAETMVEVAATNDIIAADQFHWTALLTRLEELLPNDVSVLNVQPNFQGRSLQLTAVARDVPAMTAFLDNLLVSEDFSQAYLSRHNETETKQPSGPSQSSVSFSLEIREAF